MPEAKSIPALNRRGALKAFFGLAVVATGATSLLLPGAAEAASLAAPSPLPEPAAPEFADETSLPKAEQAQYYYRRRRYVQRRYYYRRPVYRRRYVRRRVVRRVYFY